MRDKAQERQMDVDRIAEILADQYDGVVGIAIEGNDVIYFANDIRDDDDNSIVINREDVFAFDHQQLADSRYALKKALTMSWTIKALKPVIEDQAVAKHLRNLREMLRVG